MKEIFKKHGKKIIAALIVIIFTIIFFPRQAVWCQFVEPMAEGTWKQLNKRDISYEKQLSWSETRQLKSILRDTELYDTRKYAIDRDSGVFDGELKVNGTIYSVDLSSRLVLSDQKVGWLSEEHADWLKLVCLKPAIPADDRQ